MSVDRRELFQIIGGGFMSGSASAQHEHRTPTSKQGDYEPRVLNTAEYATLQRLLELLLPADEASPSARDAGVGMYIDTTLKHGDDSMRSAWTSGLAAIERVAREAAGRGFAQLSVAEGTGVLTQIARGEADPDTEAEKFFVIFKQSAIAAYYLSDAGRKSLGYTGDRAIRDFPGCTHAEHKTA